MTAKFRSLRHSLLIGASISSLMISGVADAQSHGGRVFGNRGGTADPAAAAVRAAQAQAQRQAQTNSASQRAIQAMRRAAETRQQMIDAQAAARAAAKAAQSSVPNGLGNGGLQVADGVVFGPDGKPIEGSLWVGADGPRQSQSEDGRTNVAIDQTREQAILTWDSFNVGKETDLQFNQGGTDWVALNRVTDAQADPTKILGSIKADGSVYILNRNGVIFGGASQVNVRNLVAATASITNEQFLERGIYSSLTGSGANARYEPSFTDAGGAVTVEAGAQITTNTPESVTAGGGYVLLMGTEVTNAGTITTPRGQTALSAGDDFIIRRGFGTEENQTSTTRGNEVRGLIDAESLSGTVANTGLIEAAQGDITLAGRTIRQDGVLVSTTSVNQRGTIHLLNSASDAEGSVTLGADSLTIILPELDSDETALNGQRDTLAEPSQQTTITGGFDDRSTLIDRRDQSRIEIVTGGDVLFEGGSQTVANGGQVAVQANAGRITVEDNARIDVSGVMGVALDMADNSIRVNIQGNELRDSPANRDEDNLKSQDVWIDVRDLILVPDGTGGYEGDRYYTPGGLLEVGGYLDNMAHGIGEWAAVGGTITLAANEVVAQQGAVFDISGGSLDYASGYVRSTRVLGADGRMYDIRNAPAHLKIVAVGNAYMRQHDRWGAQYTEVYSNPLFSRGSTARWEDGYTVGRDAGRLILSAPTVVMEGDILAEVINGERQTNAHPDGVTDGYKVGQHSRAQAGSLVLERTGLLTGAGGPFDIDVRVGDVADDTGELATGDALPDERTGTAWFDAGRLNDAGLGGVRLETRGAIAIESDLTLADGGSLELVAPTIDIAADITARSGSISATNLFAGGIGKGTETFLLDGDSRSSITLREGAALDVRGLWVNTALDAADAGKLGLIDGGKVFLASTHDVTMEAGSRIDASSGAAILPLGAVKGGRGGDVTLIADLETSQVEADGLLTLNGTIAGFGVSGGGTLTLESGTSIVIGGTTTETEGVLGAGESVDYGVILDADYVVGEGEALPMNVEITRIEPIIVPPGGTVTNEIRTTAEIVIAADLVVPDLPGGLSWFTKLNGDSTRYWPGETVPAGSSLNTGNTIPAGFIVPADAFPDGLPLPPAPVTYKYAAGTPAPEAITLAAGTLLAPGAVVARKVAIKPATILAAGTFQQGFSDYQVTGATGLTVASGAQVDVVMPVYRPVAGAAGVATGADPSEALELWTPPLQMEDPVNGVLTQRAGASIALQAGDYQPNGRTAQTMLTIGRDARLTVDPGQAINLTSAGQLTVDGTLTAHGGSISLLDLVARTNPLDSTGDGNTRSIWVGENAVLDVSGQAFTAVDAQGRRYGTVLDGGTINLGGALDTATAIAAGAAFKFVVVRDGALLDASGAAATLDLAGRGATQVASNGGAISFASFHGLDLGGTWNAAAGGAGAAGGTLSIALETPRYLSGYDISVIRSRDLVVTQGAAESLLAPDAAPDALENGLTYGHAAIGVEQIEAAGFDNANLLSHGVIAFDGDISLTMGQSLQLFAKSLALADSSADAARIELAAPYVRLSGTPQRGGDNTVTPAVNTFASSSRASAARFLVTSDLLDIQRDVRFGTSGTLGGGAMLDRRGFDDVTLLSRGDMRFLGGDTASPVFLQTRGDLTLGARQIYPTTDAAAIVRAGWLNNTYDPERTLNIVSTGDAPEAPPYSAFGRLTLSAPVINQGGVIRAPLGAITLDAPVEMGTVNLLPGSITATSSKGLILPYGGTVDGIEWFHAGVQVEPVGAVEDASTDRGVSLKGAIVNVEEGATLDLSGGGELTGAGFVSGRGGSIDTLRHPLIEANPGYRMSAPGNMVYAIVPGHASDYAPVGPDAGAGDPMVGRQITLDGSIPGLPAGTYTLMPSTYALMPGAFRVEIAAQANPRGAAGTTTLPDGSYLAGGRLGIANTGTLEALARQVIVTPADVARTYSLYNETSYREFVLADAARLGVPRGLTPLDGQNLHLAFAAGAGVEAFKFDGTVDFSAAEGGYAGSVDLTTQSFGGNIEILAAGAAATEGFEGISIYADELNALSAARLTIGGRMALDYGQQGRFLYFTDANGTADITLREGAMLRAAEVLLVSGYRNSTTGETGAITIEAGAGIDTLGMGDTPFDSRDGYTYLMEQGSGSTRTAALLAVTNGWIDVMPASADALNQAEILIGACGASGNCDATTTLYSEGSIAFATSNRFDLGENVRYGTRNLSLGVGAVNLGTSEALAAADAAGTLPSGLMFNQQFLDRLLQGDSSTGAPALESLILNARDSVNVFGTVTLDTYDDAGNSLVDTLVLGTPAIYGAGASRDVATIRTANLVWTGSTAAPGAIQTGGAGTGSGTLTIEAERITLGYGPNVQLVGQEDAARLALGFATVNLNASERITANNKGSTAFYRSRGDYVPGEGYSYAGGDLNIATPLFTGEAGSNSRITAGGAIRVTAPEGAAAAEITGAESLGAELALTGQNVSLATAVVLPSGRLTISATDDIALGDAALLDLSGREVPFDEVKRYSWGGEVILESRNGDIRQAAGSTIDLSVENNHAGRLVASALGASAGLVDLQGAILGTASGDYDAGGTIVPYRAGFIDVRAQRLGESGTLSEQFAAFNTRLTEGGMTGGRGFQLKQGDLTIGDEVRAGEVNVSLDGGRLTVTGTIDASGAEVGAIRLAARDGLTLGGTAVLDAHGERLRVDGHGKIIDSPNRAIVELSSGNGTLVLASGARIDLRHGTAAAGADGAARGTLELNAPRLGGTTGGDIAIDARGSLTINGARSIAVNAVQRYDDAPYGTDPAASGRPYQMIDQAYLDARHAESTAFIDAALGNAALMEGKLAGLNNATYRDAFHLRPGVEIVSATPDGDLVVSGDLDLSGHRYASVNPNFQRTAAYGSGEVGALTIRAGGNLDIYGSINDGFAPPPETADDGGWLLLPGKVSYGADVIAPNGNVTLADGTQYVGGRTLNYDLPVKALTIPAGTQLPVEAVLSASVTLAANLVLTGDVFAADGTLLHAAGTRLTEPVTLPSGTRLGAGFTARSSLALRAMVWPKDVPLPPLPAGVTLDGDLTLPMGGLIPSETTLVLPEGQDWIELRPADADGRQGSNWAIAAMLPAGSQSWSMRLVAGADLDAADSRMLLPRSPAGDITLADTHMSVAPIYETTLGGLYYWAPGNFWGGVPGTPVEDWALDPSFNVCEEDAAACNLVSWVWSDGNFWGGVPGAPVEDWALDPSFNVCEQDPVACVRVGGDGTTELVGYRGLNPAFSVLRTGTGDLDLIAGGDLGMRSAYGVYTAGTQSQNVEAIFNAPRASIGSEDHDPLVSGPGATWQAWYPELGGNLLLKAGGNFSGDAWTTGGALNAGDNRTIQKSSNDPGNWLWRQGDLAGEDYGAAWWVNFGTYVSGPYLVGFTGYGTLGGGDLRVEVGGDAGAIDMLSPGVQQDKLFPRSQAVTLAIASTGRIGADGDLLLTGGGDLDVRIGGALNGNLNAYLTSNNSTDTAFQNLGLNGVVANLRGHAEIQAASQGTIQLRYGPFVASQDPKEVRAFAPYASTASFSGGGLILAPGDATFSLTTRDDLVLSGVRDAGRTDNIDAGAGVLPWFTLWTDRTAIDLFAAGGHLTPSTQLGNVFGSGVLPHPETGATGYRFVYPAIFRAAAPSGSVYMGASAVRPQESGRALNYSLMLAPSPYGELELLAGDSIYAGGYAMTRSSADPSVLATPFNPATMANISPLSFGLDNDLFAFGPNTASDAYDLAPARFYALSGDIVGLRTGEILTNLGSGANNPRQGMTLYEAGGPVWMKAGRDIVSSGTDVGTYTFLPAVDGRSTGNLIVHSNDTDVSIVSAGRDIIYSSFSIAGPGTLEISAGRTILMEDRTSVTSVGAIMPGDTRPGASIAMMAGMANGVDWGAIRTRYLDPANLADLEDGRPLDDPQNEGKAAKIYGEELSDWLENRYGFAGGGEEALAYFDDLAPEQQRIFLRQIYYAETREGGREYNDPDSARFGSYLRGRQMIATLFPDEDTEGNEIARTGDIIMFGGSGVRTNFGGDIEMMAPGGQIVAGVQGEVPPPSAGIITQGAGDIRIFSEQSLLLGLSRILTTFGGDIFAWSEEGDINAGRGAKTTVLYTPPLLTYDGYGNVRLAPQVPSSGAGIGTLNPIPEVPAGDIDLIAPLGTIDAGEAGIRVSGNINLAALQVLNAANIQVQGQASGIPQAVVVNTGALNAASSATTAVMAEATRLAERTQPQVRTEIPAIVNVRFVGFGE